MLSACRPAVSVLLGSSSRPQARRGRQTAMTIAQQVHRNISEVLLTKEQLHSRITEIGREIAADYADRKPLVIGTLKGAVVFMADLVRAIEPTPDGLELHFVRASSYGSGTVSSGKVALTMVGDAEVKGRHVLLIEDIVDSGRTAAALLDHFKAEGAASVALVTLLSKPSRRAVDCEADYQCFEVEDKFVVGMGLDYREEYRSLPYIGVLKPECYAD